MNWENITVGVCMCGSFCTFKEVLKEIEALVSLGINVVPIMSNNAKDTDTRFGEGADFKLKLEELTGNSLITSIKEAEPIGPENKLDILLVAPCTSNTMAKLANGITDGTVTMACKAHLRNNKPLVIALATNDALGTSLKNIGELMVRKNIYFVPFGQDDYKKKPLSMVAHFDKIISTLEDALDGRQTQPILL